VSLVNKRDCLRLWIAPPLDGRDRAECRKKAVSQHSPSHHCRHDAATL
ncbi:hypothetical protein LEMLEM_LOCUS5966, partial [Lemmus lemmus]